MQLEQKIKKIIILSIITGSLLLLFFNCTPAGTELSMLGTWTGTLHKTAIMNGEVLHLSLDLDFSFYQDDTGNFQFTYSDGTSYNDDFTVEKTDSIASTIKLKFKNWKEYDDTYYYSLTNNQLIIYKFKLIPGTLKADLCLNK